MQNILNSKDFTLLTGLTSHTTTLNVQALDDKEEKSKE
jgi:hypothetical protein